jgi:hypothetical protein
MQIEWLEFMPFRRLTNTSQFERSFNQSCTLRPFEVEMQQRLADPKLASQHTYILSLPNEGCYYPGSQWVILYGEHQLQRA